MKSDNLENSMVAGAETAWEKADGWLAECHQCGRLYEPSDDDADFCPQCNAQEDDWREER